MDRSFTQGEEVRKQPIRSRHSFRKLPKPRKAGVHEIPLAIPPYEQAPLERYLTWIAEGWLVAHYLGGCWLGAAVTLTAPFTAYGALLFHDQRAVFWKEARAYLLLRTRRRLAAELKTRREEVLRQVKELETLYEADSGQ